MSAQIGNTPPTINISNPDELRWWAKELGVSEDQVRGAVSRVGNSAQAVKEALKQSSAPTGSPASGGTSSGSGSQAPQSWNEHQLLPNRGLIDDERGRGSRAASRYESSQERDGAMRWVLIAVVAASVAGAIVMMRRRRNQSWFG